MTLQPALLALEDSTVVEKEHLIVGNSAKAEKSALDRSIVGTSSSREDEVPTANSLQADPLIDEAQQERRRHMATVVCAGAATPSAWEIANRLAVSWGFSCAALGVSKPADPDGERRRVGVMKHG